MGNSNNLLLILLLVIPIIIVVFVIIKKKKGNNPNDKKPSGNKLKSKDEADEVWLTIKKHLRDTNEHGKEVIDSYVIKRPDPMNPKNPELKQRKAEIKKLKSVNHEKYKVEKEKLKIDQRKKPAELYVVLFTTKNPKTGQVDEQRGIECEVVYKKIDKNNRQRTIIVNGKVDLQKEMKWIKPIKDKDDKQLAKQLKVEQKRRERLAKKQQNKKKNTKKS
ncbi:MAG: DUF5385 domain-containing protein [Candidatus Ureaplasma intestinipullorum]|uniref:DUF5385 domain-containing protein n=1 Tax=Candidatus Ureaplasma intestinipullorum TaxID=2838770 RepID=A0A9E2KWA5_9BACT|nr:DUF5385 domain-containing protein [Candidatus Ureaplasma intestinipullorum]